MLLCVATALSALLPPSTAQGGSRAAVRCQLSDEAIAAKLQRMQRQRPQLRGRRAASAGSGGQAAEAASARVLPGSESAEVAVWEVPERLRMPGSERVHVHGRHYSLDELFPHTGLAEAWDMQLELRTALRRALRTDLFVPFLPKEWDARRIACATGLGAACMVSWRAAVERECDAFTAAFKEHGVRLTGRDFILGMGSLCGPEAAGSLIDIVPIGRRVVHSWHQVRCCQ